MKYFFVCGVNERLVVKGPIFPVKYVGLGPSRAAKKFLPSKSESTDLFA